MTYIILIKEHPMKEGVPSKHPIGAPFDGSRQVNCHRLLRGLDVDRFRDRDVSALARLGIFIGGYAFQSRLASQVNGPIWF